LKNQRATNNNIGSSLGRTGHHKQALSFKQKALTLWLELLGEKHTDIATSYDNIGTSHGDLGQHELALSLNKKALALRLELFGEKHPNTALSYNNIGCRYGKLGQPTQELAFFQRSLKLRFDLQGPEHPESVRSLHHIVIALVELKQFKKAHDNFYQFKKTLPEKHQHKQKLDGIQGYINQQSSKAGFRTLSHKSGAQKKPRKKNKRK
jgi:tetratricopeptide (TPR) repeat protein